MRQAWVWLGVLTWIMLLPLVWLLVHDRPEAVGLRPDGGGSPSSAGVQAQAGTITGLTRAEALRQPAFYIIGAGLFSLSMLVTTIAGGRVEVMVSSVTLDLASSVMATRSRKVSDSMVLTMS